MSTNRIVLLDYLAEREWERNYEQMWGEPWTNAPADERCRIKGYIAPIVVDVLDVLNRRAPIDPIPADPRATARETEKDDR